MEVGKGKASPFYSSKKPDKSCNTGQLQGIRGNVNLLGDQIFF